MIALGSRVQDRITGYEGIVICRSVWLFGCVRITVQATTLKDGCPLETQCVDEAGLDLLLTAPGPLGSIARSVSEYAAGPRPDPLRAPDPVR